MLDRGIGILSDERYFRLSCACTEQYDSQKFESGKQSGLGGIWGPPPG